MLTLGLPCAAPVRASEGVTVYRGGSAVSKLDETSATSSRRVPVMVLEANVKGVPKAPMKGVLPLPPGVEP